MLTISLDLIMLPLPLSRAGAGQAAGHPGLATTEKEAMYGNEEGGLRRLHDQLQGMHP